MERLGFEFEASFFDREAGGRVLRSFKSKSKDAAFVEAKKLARQAGSRTFDLYRKTADGRWQLIKK